MTDLPAMGVAERTALLKRWALDAGFDRVGVATLEPLEHGGALLKWLERGDHAGMGWMERATDVRREPERLFPGARTALCVALQYFPRPRTENPGGDLWPRVARYARGRDYHNVIGKRLKALARRIREAFPGTETRTCVDTGPVLERPLAARAGLGAVGKNTLLLDADAGSWFLLGEVFTSLDLTPDPPVADLCGRCTACLAACPTGALPEAYRLVAHRCISYWTIEHRGAFPAAVRPLLEDWVFGCDVCQEACPANATTLPATDEAFDPPPRRSALDLVSLLRLSAEEYEEVFHGSPMRRAGLSGLRRNAAVAMGNRRDARYVPALAASLENTGQRGDSVVRRHAAWALGEIGGAEARESLLRAREREVDPEVLGEIVTALKRCEMRFDG